MTRPSTLTGEGAIVGTLHYMSPEQLEGRNADARSDIFSFGAVLFEMLSGRKAFDGPSQASIIAAVIEAPRPRLSGTGGPHASRVDRVLSKCLAKDPDDRWQSARDLGDELRWLNDDVTRPDNATSAQSATRGPAAWLTFAAAAMAMTVGVASWGAWERWRAPAPAIELPDSRFILRQVSPIACGDSTCRQTASNSFTRTPRRRQERAAASGYGDSIVLNRY